jgi:HD-like signal output (HDOD) protein
MSFIGKTLKNKIPNEILYTIGLFRDCGIPLLALKYKNYKDILMEANNNGESSVALEERHYKTNHVVLGYYVASSWNLPKNICALILQHHDKRYLSVLNGSKEQMYFSVLKAAENMIEMIKRKSLSPDWNDIEKDALNVLGISSTDYADLVSEFTEFYNQ